MSQGRSSGFRRRSLVERLVTGAGAWLPGGVRARLRAMFHRLLARTHGDLVCTLPSGERIRVLPEHRQITWNPDEYTAFRASVRPGDTILDIGANLGAYTLLFGGWTGAWGRVFAFAPAPSPFAGLTAHVALNGLSGHVVTLQQAVSASDGTAEFIADGVDGSNRLTTDRTGAAATLTVTKTSVDSFCDRMGITPHLIKIDAEGAELDVLRGARRTILAAGPGLTLYVEMHPHLWSAFGTSRAEIEAELADQRLVPERLDGQADIWGIEGVCLRLRTCAS